MAGSYYDHIMELLAPMGVVPRAMFGGHGLFKGGVMVGLIAADELYFKVDATTRPQYEAKKSRPFVYEGKGSLKDNDPDAPAIAKRKAKPITMGFWLVPEDVLEDKEALRRWLDQAYDIALKARKETKGKPRPRRPMAPAAAPRRRGR